MSDDKVFTAESKPLVYHENATLTLYTDGRLYGQGRCYDSQWNRILHRSSPTLLAKGISKVYVETKGFALEMMSQGGPKDDQHWPAPWLHPGGMGPSGYDHSIWVFEKTWCETCTIS